MAEHRFFQPDSDQSERCDCELCLRHDQLMVEMEAAIAAPVGGLLDAGWLPREIVELVKTGSPASSKASMLVRIDMLRRATDWSMSGPFRVHQSQASELAKRTGMRCGQPQAGWFEQWLWTRNRGDVGTARRYIRHEYSALMPVLELVIAAQDTVEAGGIAWPHPRVTGRRGLSLLAERQIPDGSDDRWRE